MNHKSIHPPSRQNRDYGGRVEVAAGLIFRDGQLLIARRHPESHLGGLWEFPGGKREPNESFEECLRRELREELGIEIQVGERFESLTHDYPDRTVHLEFFQCQLAAGEPQALGCSEFKWIDRTGLDEQEFPAADARLLDRLRTNNALWR